MAMKLPFLTRTGTTLTINIVFIKYIGLFAAALSTMISYMIMAIYRHLDLRKYMNIKIESDLLIKSIFMFTFVIICYYINNIYLNIFSLVTAIIYSYLMNKNFLFSSFIISQFVININILH